MSLYERLLGLAKSHDLIHKTTNLDVLKEDTEHISHKFSIEAQDIDLSYEDVYYDFCNDVAQDLLSLWFPNITQLIEGAGYSWSKAYNLDLDVHTIVSGHYNSKN